MTDEYKDLIDQIDIALESRLKDIEPAQIKNAMRYSVFNGGKRVRPLLMLCACLDLGGSILDVLPFACAIELIHTYSLIHDDLPAMDNDDFRRGKPTNHKVFGEGVAILAGDGLLNLAYEVMAEECLNAFDSNLNSRARTEAMLFISKAAGTSGMVGGQTADIIYENQSIDESILLYIDEKKTGALFKAVFGAGSILAGKSDHTVMMEIGEALGLAFQIQDDIFDADEINGTEDKKNTYVTMYGLEEARNKYKGLFANVYKKLELLSISGMRLHKLIQLIEERKI